MSVDLAKPAVQFAPLRARSGEPQVSSGSGTELSYRVEIRCDHAFVAWDIKGYECAATPRAEFVVGPQWQSVPLTTLPEPFGIAPRRLELSHFASKDEVCYTTAKAIQFALLSRWQYHPGLEIRVTQITTKYQYTQTENSDAPIEACFGARFAEVTDAPRSGSETEEPARKVDTHD